MARTCDHSKVSVSVRDGLHASQRGHDIGIASDQRNRRPKVLAGPKGRNTVGIKPRHLPSPPECNSLSGPRQNFSTAQSSPKVVLGRVSQGQEWRFQQRATQGRPCVFQILKGKECNTGTLARPDEKDAIPSHPPTHQVTHHGIHVLSLPGAKGHGNRWIQIAPAECEDHCI
jgi:hypothetical protein